MTVTGTLTANGGGGAGPAASTGARGSALGSTPATGGTFAACPAGPVSGGAGGTSVAPFAGGSCVFDDGVTIMARGGGGGGAAGRIELRARTLTSGGATFSPPPITSQPSFE